MILAAAYSMFKIVADPTFTCEVRLSRPESDTPVPVKITWRHKGARDLTRWLSTVSKADDDAAFLGQVIADWQGIGDKDGAPLPYSLDALRTLLATFPSAGREMVQAYTGRLTDARAKN